MAFYKGLQRIATVIRVFTIIIVGIIVVGGVFLGGVIEEGGLAGLVVWVLGAGVVLTLGLIAAWIIEGFAQRE